MTLTHKLNVRKASTYIPIVNKRVSVIIMNNDQLEIYQLWLYSQIYVIKFEYLQLVLMHQLIDLPVVTTGQKTSNLRKTRKWRNSDSSSKKDRIYSGFEFVKTKNNVHKVENQTIRKKCLWFWTVVFSIRLKAPLNFSYQTPLSKNNVMSEILKNRQDVVSLSDLERI